MRTVQKDADDHVGDGRVDPSAYDCDSHATREGHADDVLDIPRDYATGR